MQHPCLTRIATLPRVALLSVPTPLENLPGLSKSMGRLVRIKRDDLGGVGAGGNKLRKLEFLLGAAEAEGVDTVLTTGGVQSNHCRLTAAAAARCGLRCELFLKGTKPASMGGNLLLNALFGAQTQFCDVPDYVAMNEIISGRMGELAREGRRAMFIPLGGARAEGTIGYIEAARELLAQLGHAAKPPFVALAGGTGSTAAGLALGFALLSPEARLLVISASWSADRLSSEIDRNYREAAEFLGIAPPSMPDLRIDDTQIGSGYTKPTNAARDALHALARKDGILLDMTYTAKAMAGLRAGLQTHDAEEEEVIFLHTGGSPELYARSETTLWSGRHDFSGDANVGV